MLGKREYTFTGQSLPEYVIILGVVGLSLIGGFTLLGQTSSAALNNMNDKINKVGTQSGVYDVSALMGKPEVINASGGAGFTSVASSVNSNGSNNSAAFAISTSTLSNSIETTGANGSTELLLANLESQIPATC